MADIESSIRQALSDFHKKTDGLLPTAIYLGDADWQELAATVAARNGTFEIETVNLCPTFEGFPIFILRDLDRHIACS